MNDLRPENRALFAAARADYEPSGEDRARLGRALGIGTGAAAVVIASSSSAAAGVPLTTAGSAGAAALPPIAGLGGLAVGKWAVVAAIVAVAAGTAGVSYVARDSAPPARRSAVVAETPRPEAPVPMPTVPPVEPPERVELLSPKAVSLPSVVTPRVAPPASNLSTRPLVDAPVHAIEGGVQLEARLLREADAALRAHDVATATARLDEHARAFPNGVLVEERELERILVRCAEGDRPGALAKAATFLQAHPGSVLSDRVRSACASGTTTVTEGATPGH